MIKMNFVAHTEKTCSYVHYFAPESIRVFIKALQALSRSGDPDAKYADELAGLLASLMKLAGYYMEED